MTRPRESCRHADPGRRRRGHGVSIDPPSARRSQSVVCGFSRDAAARRSAAGRDRRSALKTADGVDIRVEANVDLLGDATFAMSQGAEGIGLFRSELLLAGPPGGRADRGHAVRGVPAAARGRASRAGHRADVRHRRRSARQRRAPARHALGERIRGAAQPARAAIDSAHAEAARAAAHAAARAGAGRGARRSARDVSVRVGHRGAARSAKRAGRGATGNRGARASGRARCRSAS